jgi:fructosamine-3-kinase
LDTVPKLSDDVLAWVHATVGRVVDAIPLRDGTFLRVPWRLHITTRAGAVDAILKTGSSKPGELRGGVTNVQLRDSFAAEAAGLEFAEIHNLRTPRLLGLDLDGVSGGLAILSTALPGHTGVPNTGLLRAFGLAAAELHAIPVNRNAAPLRTRPRPSDHEVWLRRWAATYQSATGHERGQIVEHMLVERPGLSTAGLRERLLRVTTTPLIQEAERRIAEFRPEVEQTVLVHADLCSGNTMWTDAGLVGIIDWESWGAGHYGVDLGNIRFEESMRFGSPAAKEVLDGWQQAADRAATDIAYWDLVAALNTPTDMTRWSGGDPTARQRRDEFLRAAVARFDRT